MAVKIAFIGAGSFGFTRAVVRDILSYPRLADAHIALMDIDPERLAAVRACCRKIVSSGGYPARITTTTDRRRALDGADAVVATILSGGTRVWQYDILIPKRYGVDLCVGDTRGPGGVFRALRTLPDMLAIARDMKACCPGALLLNYTNPMGMLCHALQTAHPRLAISGLCHSVPSTARRLARWLEVPPDSLDYRCAGLNHMAWFLRLEHKGRDQYPRLRQLVSTRPDIYDDGKVRNEMFLALGYYVTETSGHNSEYNPWFRKRPDLLRRYCDRGADSNPGRHAAILAMYRRRDRTWRRDLRQWIEHPDWNDPDKKAAALQRGREYAAGIIHAWMGGAPYDFNGNVPNHGLIPNLPDGACIEIPVRAGRKRLRPATVGDLPKPVLGLTALTAHNEMLAVEGALAGDARRVFQSIAHDPLTSAVLSLAEIRDMVRAMFRKNRAFLHAFHPEAWKRSGPRFL